MAWGLYGVGFIGFGFYMVWGLEGLGFRFAGFEF